MLSKSETPFRTAGTSEQLKVYPTKLEVLSADGYRWGVIEEVDGVYDTVKLGRIDEMLKLMAIIPAVYVT